MNISAIRTHKITNKDTNLFRILDQYLPTLRDYSILAITSKIVSICEGRIVRVGTISKENLVEREAEYYLPSELNKFGFSLTITRGVLTPAAGIDESNANGYYVLWPENLQRSVNSIRNYLVKRFGLENIGVIITDSRTMPLHWGTVGTCLAHSGFYALNDYRNTPDIFGRHLKVTQSNIAESLAAAAVLTMGEGSEQTPIAVIEGAPLVQFKKRNPTAKELKALRLTPEIDIYAPLLTSVKWIKGKK
jgi:putative folate metabolism gamma-glutamate ligase